MSTSRKPRKPQGPITRVSRIAVLGLAAGILTFIVGVMFMARLTSVVSEPLAALAPGVSSGLLGWLVLVLPVASVGAVVAYGAGMLIEARPWGFAVAQQLGALALPIGLGYVVGPSQSPLSPALIVASVVTLMASTWLCAFAFRRGGRRMRTPASQPVAVPPKNLSQIDFEAIKCAEAASPSAEVPPPGGEPPAKP